MPRVRNLWLLAPIGIVCVAIVLRFADLGTQSLWVDETFTARLLGGSLGHLLSGVGQLETTPPLYYILVWAWTKMFGTSEVALRTLSAMFSVACVPVMFMVVRTLVGRRAAVVAAALVATSPALVWYAQEARSYSLWLFLTAVGLLFWIRAVDDPTARNLTLWSVASGLSLCTHYLAVAFVVPQGAWLLWRHRSRRMAIAVGGVGLAALALAPLALHQRSLGGTNWIPAIPLGSRLKTGYWFFTTGWEGSWDVAAPIVVVLAELAIVLALFRGSERVRRGTIVSQALVLMTLALVFVGVLIGDDFLVDRNVLPCLLLFIVGVAAAAGSPGRAGVLGVVIALAICVVFVRQDIRIATTPSLQRDDWRAAARALGHSSTPRVIVVGPGWENPALDYYLPHVRDMPAASATRELDIVTWYDAKGRAPTPPGEFRVESDVWLQNWRVHVVRLRSERPVRLVPSSLKTSDTDGFQPFVQGT